jgi:beta-ribofuranosylaminobenzene 5'-phosphate synthase
MIRINIPFRLHITLIAMHDCSYRKNGGIGLGVDIGCTLVAKKSLKTTIKVNGVCNDLKKISDIEKLVESISLGRKFCNKTNIIINGDIYFHSGLGAGTALTLACIEAAFLINEIDYDIAEIKALSGRGGTSGIGVSSYFNGGFILDLGHEASNTPHQPSHFVTNHNLPISLNKVPFNFDNLFYLLPIEAPLIHGECEKEFFNKNTPIDTKSVYETCYLSIFGVLASVIECNLKQFSESIDAIQGMAWKSLEIERAGKIVKSLMHELKELKCLSVGMSSLGHGIFFILNNFKDLDKVTSLALTNHCKLIPLVPSNNGRVIEIV